MNLDNGRKIWCNYDNMIVAATRMTNITTRREMIILPLTVIEENMKHSLRTVP